MTSITEFSKVCQCGESERGDILETVSELDERKSKSFNQMAASEAGILPGNQLAVICCIIRKLAGRQGFVPSAASIG